MEENRYLNVGYIVKTRGLKGVVKIKSTSYFAASRYKKGNKLYLADKDGNIVTSVTANTYSNEGDFDYVSFKEFDDINQVEKFIGYSVLVNKDEIPPLPKDTYYYHELEGLTCVDENNNPFGVVLSMVDYTAQPSFKIKIDKNNKQILIPFVDFYIKKVDLENKQIVVHVIPGLID